MTSKSGIVEKLGTSFLTTLFDVVSIAKQVKERMTLPTAAHRRE
jgi:hypothetical protein